MSIFSSCFVYLFLKFVYFVRAHTILFQLRKILTYISKYSYGELKTPIYIFIIVQFYVLYITMLPNSWISIIFTIPYFSFHINYVINFERKSKQRLEYFHPWWYHHGEIIWLEIRINLIIRLNKKTRMRIYKGTNKKVLQFSTKMGRMATINIILKVHEYYMLHL